MTQLKFEVYFKKKNNELLKTKIMTFNIRVQDFSRYRTEMEAKGLRQHLAQLPSNRLIGYKMEAPGS